MTAPTTETRPTDAIRDAFDRARLDDLRGALEIHGWLTGEDSKEALDEIERAWGEIERVTLARDIAETAEHRLTEERDEARGLLKNAYNDRDTMAAEIERLTAELAARAPADASLEARAEIEVRTAADIVSDLLDFAEAREWSDQIHDYGDYFYAGCDACEAREDDGEHGPRCTRKALFLVARAFIEAERSAVVRAVDASRPTTERTFSRVTLGTVEPGSLIEIASGSIGIACGAPLNGQRPVLWIATGHVDLIPADATVSLRATPAELDALTSADASRPGLTEEQARALNAAASMLPWIGLCGGRDMAPDDCIAMNYAREHMRHAFALLRASRGETGPAPDPLALDPEDGTLCADCRAPRNTIHSALCSVRAGAKPGRVPDPRATLHAGDPASVPDPRVDYSDSMRPAVLGGECAECLHAPPLHERTCSKVARRPQ